MGFMRRYFKVKDEDVGIRVLCHLDNSLGLDEIHRYWLDQLNLPATCLRTATIRNLGTPQKRKHKYGVCTIRICEVAKVQKLWGAIQELIGCERPEWLEAR